MESIKKSVYLGNSLPAGVDDDDSNMPKSIFNSCTHPCEQRCIQEQEQEQELERDNIDLTDVINTVSDDGSSSDDSIDLDALMSIGKIIKPQPQLNSLDKDISVKQHQVSNKISLLSSLIESWDDKRCSWDEYFSCIALLISTRSTSKRLKVGSVIVKNNRIISAGYNGFPSGTPHVSIMRDGHEQNTIHAEQNAIADAARRGVSIENTTIYVTHRPCINCTKFIISAGITNIKYLKDYRNDELADELLNASKITIQKV
jgi:dCMP deaminase|tara:strand:- start:3121 stop:3897 length:777 start_codon:yes stop_codon:yes gene_type:complete